MDGFGNVFPFIWRCCGGEMFLYIPGMGLTHVPGSLDVLEQSHFFAIYCGAAISLSIFLWIMISVVNWLWKCSRGSLASFHGAKIAPAIAIVILPSLLKGAPGRHVIRRVGFDVSALRADDLERLQAWKRRPKESPFERVRAHSDASKRRLHLNGPEGNHTVFSEDEAAEIANRVLKYQQSHWTFSAGLSHGTGIFLLGYKYGGQLFNGSAFTKIDNSRVRKMWEEFDDVFERVRAWCEIAFGAPARLQRGGLWPPVFIMHMPSGMQTIREVMDVHSDALVGGRPSFKDVVLDALSARPNWSRTTCAWSAQFSVVIALSVHKGGSGLEYYELDERGAPVMKDLEHRVGRAHVIESERAHNLRPFEDGDGLHPRMVIHAFVFPCWPADRPEAMEMQVVGTIGR